MSHRKHPDLWEKAKEKAMKNAERWNARVAQHAVKIYKSMGGEYYGRKNPRNSLVKWTREDWGYVDNDPRGRYLPKKVRENLTKKQKKITNSNKKRGAKKGKKNVKWEKFIADLM